MRIIGPLVAMAFLGVVMSGCEDRHIGRVCDLDIADAGAPTTGTSSALQAQAVECPTRLCLLPAAQTATNTGPLCTALCSSDDDCAAGETTSDPNSKQCKHGFVCAVATTFNEHCCEKMCVCKDFLDLTQDPHETPATCLPGHSTCKNVR